MVLRDYLAFLNIKFHLIVVGPVKNFIRFILLTLLDLVPRNSTNAFRFSRYEDMTEIRDMKKVRNAIVCVMKCDDQHYQIPF